MLLGNLWDLPGTGVLGVLVHVLVYSYIDDFKKCGFPAYRSTVVHFVRYKHKHSSDPKIQYLSVTLSHEAQTAPIDANC